MITTFLIYLEHTSDTGTFSLQSLSESLRINSSWQNRFRSCCNGIPCSFDLFLSLAMNEASIFPIMTTLDCGSNCIGITKFDSFKFNTPIVIGAYFIFQLLYFGICINNMLSISKENVLEDKNQNVVELATGIKSWSGFAKKHQLVRVVLTEVYRISKQPRKKDNSFGLDKDEIDKYTIILPVDTQTSELGRKVLEAFDLK